MGIFPYIQAVVTDRELLVRLDEKVEMIYVLLTNHLEHHFAYNIALFGAMLSLTAGMIIWVVKTRQMKGRGE